MPSQSSPERELPRTITVTGIGRASIRPDIADLRLGVTITEATVDVARAASAKVQNAVLAKLKSLGIEERDLQTSIVSVQPQYDYSQQSAPPRLVGYQFTNVVAATLREIEKVGDAIDAALGAGATSIDQMAFRVAEQSGAETEERERPSPRREREPRRWQRPRASRSSASGRSSRVAARRSPTRRR